MQNILLCAEHKLWYIIEVIKYKFFDSKNLYLLITNYYFNLLAT